MVIRDLSSVTVLACGIDNNGAYGILVGGGSVLTVQNGHISGNSYGIGVDQNAYAEIAGSVVIANNTNYGLRVYGGRALIGGIDVQILGSNMGIAVNSGTVVTGGDSLLIQGNTTWGVFLSADSSIRFNSTTTTIEGNGTAGCVTLDCGGIAAYVGSYLDLLGCTVRNNYGVGAWLSMGSSGRVGNNSITGNGGPGVYVGGLSSAMVYTNTISGNAGFDLYCTPSSYVSGDKTGIGRMSCTGFNNDPLPGREKNKDK